MITSGHVPCCRVPQLGHRASSLSQKACRAQTATANRIRIVIHHGPDKISSKHAAQTRLDCCRKKACLCPSDLQQPLVLFVASAGQAVHLRGTGREWHATTIMRTSLEELQQTALSSSSLRSLVSVGLAALTSQTQLRICRQPQTQKNMSP